MLQGPSVELYKKILAVLPDLYLVASGGVSSMRDVEELASINMPAVIIGKAIYENRITISELSKFVS